MTWPKGRSFDSLLPEIKEDLIEMEDLEYRQVTTDGREYYVTIIYARTNDGRDEELGPPSVGYIKPMFQIINSSPCERSDDDPFYHQCSKFSRTADFLFSIEKRKTKEWEDLEWEPDLRF